MTTTPARMLACVALLASAFAIAACGDDDGSSANQAQADQQATGAGEVKAPTGSDEQQIKQVFRNVQAAFVKQDGQAYCDDLAQPGQAEVVRFGKTISIKGDCPAVISRLSKNSADAGLKQVRAKIVQANIQGDKAKATIKDADRPPIQMQFTKIDGQWKLQSPGFEDALEPKGGRAQR